MSAVKILVTGGAGFIGSHLSERLLGEGHSVVIYDNFSTGSWKNVAHLAGRATIYQRDCRDRRSLRDAARGCEFAYHLAASLGVRNVLSNTRECIENNFDSARAVFSLGIPGIFASTSEVYGRAQCPLREDSPFVYSSAKRWSYAAGKLLDEYLALEHDWNVVRLFNVVGARQSLDSGMVIPRFISQALGKKPLTVYGDGKQTRCFLDVRECAAALAFLRDGGDFEIVNVGSGTEYSIRRVAYLVQELYPQSRIESISYVEAYPHGFEECERRVPDLTRLRKLGITPGLIPLRQTILDIASYLRLNSTPEVSHVRPKTEEPKLCGPPVC